MICGNCGRPAVTTIYPEYAAPRRFCEECAPENTLVAALKAVEALKAENDRLRAALEPLLRHFEVRMMQYGRASQGQRYVSPNHFYFPGIAQIDAAHEALNHTPNASQLPVQLSGPDEHAFDGQD